MALDMSKYLALFVQEATEHLEGWGRDLVQLEREGHSPATIDSLFRHAHSVKGMAASMGFAGVVQLAHRAEDLIDRVRGSPDAIGAEMTDVLLATGDRLLELVRLAEAGADVSEPGAVVAQLDALLASEKSPPPPVAIEKAPEPKAARTSTRVQVDVEIASTCATPGVRAFLVHKKLAALGRIELAVPSLDDCKAGRIPDGRLRLVVRTEAEHAVIEKALAAVADLSLVEVAAAPEAELTPATPATPATPPMPEKGSGTVRVRTETLDALLDGVGELILATSRLRELGRFLPERYRPPMDEGVDALHRIVKDLHGKVMSVRMTPIALLTDRLPRIARDIARALGRELELEVTGADIELDRAILEELGDAFTHVIRNCVDHGLEPPEEREKAGKPARGRLIIRARRDRARVVLEVEDDGRGMDPEKLKASAIARGAITAELAKKLERREALLLSCLPGVSTATSVSDLSGRGVGMDAVKAKIESLGGTLEIDSTVGKGTRFSMSLPLTVAVVPLLLLRSAEEIFGLPIAKVLGAVEASPSTLKGSVGVPLLAFGEELVPVRRLARMFELEEIAGDHPRPHVVVEGEGGHFALQVDGLLGQEEAVLKPLTPPLDRVTGLAGVTILGSGRPIFILDVPRLFSPGGLAS